MRSSCSCRVDNRTTIAAVEYFAVFFFWACFMVGRFHMGMRAYCKAGYCEFDVYFCFPLLNRLVMAPVGDRDNERFKKIKKKKKQRASDISAGGRGPRMCQL